MVPACTETKGAAYIGCQALMPGRVIAASVRENQATLLKWLPGRPNLSMVFDRLETFAADVGRSEIEGAVGASWTSLAVKENPKADKDSTV